MPVRIIFDITKWCVLVCSIDFMITESYLPKPLFSGHTVVPSTCSWLAVFIEYTGEAIIIQTAMRLIAMKLFLLKQFLK